MRILLQNEDEEDDDDEEFKENKGHAYINLTKKSCKGQSLWKRKNRCFGLIRGLCLCFVIISGFLVLVALLWLNFSLRTQTQDLSAQLYQGYSDVEN